MLSSFKSGFRKMGMFATCAVAIAMLIPTALHATPVTYNVVLTPNAGNAFGGTGSFTIASAPMGAVSSYTKTAGTITALSFLIDGQTFNLAGAQGTVLIQFTGNTLTDITFSQTIGTTPMRFSLMSSGGYVFDYNNLQSQSIGSFTATLAPVAATPEPSSILLLFTGLLGIMVILYRRHLTSLNMTTQHALSSSLAN